MKKKILNSLITLVCIFSFCFCLTGCFGESVVPCAWVKLDMDGYIVYTANMYASGGDHIYLYETEEEAAEDRYHANYLVSVVFYPRILGADTIEGIKTTTVDISSNYSMTIYVNKTRSAYSAEKKVYLNDEEITSSQVDDLDVLLCMTFDNFTLVRGNPGGRMNNFVNKIEYK